MATRYHQVYSYGQFAEEDGFGHEKLEGLPPDEASALNAPQQQLINLAKFKFSDRVTQSYKFEIQMRAKCFCHMSMRALHMAPFLMSTHNKLPRREDMVN